MQFDDINSTADVVVPTEVMERIIGQGKAVEKVKVAIRQRRNLLLVGPPGVGKSMLAQGLANHLPATTQQISVVDNPKNKNKPLVEILSRDKVEKMTPDKEENNGKIVSPVEVPSFVAIRLGFRCSNCGALSTIDYLTCPQCGSNKYSRLIKSKKQDPINNMLTDVFEVGQVKPETEIQTSMRRPDGGEEIRIYQRTKEDKIRILDQKSIERMKHVDEKSKRNIIVPLMRKNFVHVSGASEVELLGDVRHDPYGMHPEIGTPAYLRVVSGAIHEAHEGVLFVDELPHLENLQNYILTAMQEKHFPITGRNPQSAGASVKVTNVPCDFLFVGACNIRDVSKILPPLRSRISGNGYELLLETTMEDNLENRKQMLQFISQEIASDGRIPHAVPEVVEEIVLEAKRRAKALDGVSNALTLRLRDLGGVIRMSGDIAVIEESEFIEAKHVKRSLKESKSIEHQLQERYGSIWEGMSKDSTNFPSTEHADKSYG